MKDLIKQNYEITRRRGLITYKTTVKDFMNKLKEEYIEVGVECLWMNVLERSDINKKRLKYELADVILVCMNFATHLEIDIEQALKEKIEINRKRINHD